VTVGKYYDTVLDSTNTTEKGALKMALKHVYDELVRVVPFENATQLILGDGTKITFPLEAVPFVSILSLGDRVLLDLKDWDNKGVATIRVYRNGGSEVSSCMVGSGCRISGPVFLT